MAKYVFGCGSCGVITEVGRPMAEGPPEENPLCCKCQTRMRRIYVPVPIKFVGDGFSTSGKFDRPDERVHAEIEKSKDFDPTTGKSWEKTDREMKKKKSRGLVKKKDIVLPQSG